MYACLTARTRNVQAELCTQDGHAGICESLLAFSLQLRTTVLSDSRKEAALLAERCWEPGYQRCLSDALKVKWTEGEHQVQCEVMRVAWVFLVCSL